MNRRATTSKFRESYEKESSLVYKRGKSQQERKKKIKSKRDKSAP